MKKSPTELEISEKFLKELPSIQIVDTLWKVIFFVVHTVKN